MVLILSCKPEKHLLHAFSRPKALKDIGGCVSQEPLSLKDRRQDSGIGKHGGANARHYRQSDRGARLANLRIRSAKLCFDIIRDAVAMRAEHSSAITGAC